jgi:hypothetical protein
MIEQYHSATSYERTSERAEGLADKKEKMENAGANTVLSARLFRLRM